MRIDIRYKTTRSWLKWIVCFASVTIIVDACAFLGISGSLTTPESLSVTVVSTTEAELSWTDTNDSESGFTVEQASGTDGSFSSGLTIDSSQPDSTGAVVVTISDLIAGGSYRFRVFAFDATNQSDPTAEVSITMPLSVTSSGTLISKLSAVDGAPMDQFGIAVDISGDTLAVGASLANLGIWEPGAVYLYQRSGPALWGSGVRIDPPDTAGTHGGQFGFALGIDGDFLSVGAFLQNYENGAVYVFARGTNSSWDSYEKLESPDPDDYDRFGWSTAISNDKLIVGADRDDAAGTDAGAAYVFIFAGSSWDTGIKLTAADGASDDAFGHAVAISGDYAVVGAPGEDSAGSDAGATYVFKKGAGSTWGAGYRLMNAGLSAGDEFGGSVAVDGDYILVSAHLDDSGGFINSGAVYVYERTGSNEWGAPTKLTAPDPSDADVFGWDVSISETSGVIGAKSAGDQIALNAGSVYTISRDPTQGWVIDAIELLAPDELEDDPIEPDPRMHDAFGYSVALDQGTIVIGAAAGDTTLGQTGSAYVFE